MGRIIFTAFFVLMMIIPTMVHAAEVTIEKANGEKVVFSAEIADTDGARARGLMHRNSMPEKHGMLFVFDLPEMARFWMKGTLIPLDIIFIKPDGKICNIHENAQPMVLSPIPAVAPVKFVLEINGGEAQKYGISAGDHVKSNLAVNGLEFK
ncbi:MAG: DUF192 domain-containing protein [Pseudobdellovibrionaceae bacterium]